MGGGAVVAVAAAARRRRILAVVDAFRAADATSPDRATSFPARGIDPDRRETRQLIRERVLLPGGSAESWYLSEAGYIAHRDAREHRVRIALIVVLLIVLALSLAAVMVRGG